MPTNKIRDHVLSDLPDDTILGKGNGVKQKRTPRNYDSILKGALNLALAERVQLKNEIIKSINNDVANAKLAAELAIKLAEE